ncbi:hypothetical protein Tco_0207343, partial [Tanacetum coccineum]
TKTKEGRDREDKDHVEELERRDTAKDSLGVSRESSKTHSTHRESWWFGEEVQTKIAAKHASGLREKKMEGSKKGANDTYRIAKARERRRMDLGNIRYIKDEEGRTIVIEEDIRKR